VFVLTRLSHVKPGTEPVPGVAPAAVAAD